MDQEEPEEKMRQLQGGKTTMIYDDMSGFYRNKGGMVCTFSKGKLLELKVLGLCEISRDGLTLNLADRCGTRWRVARRTVQCCSCVYHD